jgi:hypothetical protein
VALTAKQEVASEFDRAIPAGGDLALRVFASGRKGCPADFLGASVSAGGSADADGETVETVDILECAGSSSRGGGGCCC